MDQTCNFPGMPRASGTARVEGIPRHAGGKSHRSDHTRNRRLDADLSAGDAVDHPIAEADSAVLADRVAKDVWAVCFFLRHVAFDDLCVAGQVFQRAGDVGGCGETAVHYCRAYCVCIDDPAGVDLDEGMDPADWGQALADAPPADLFQRCGGCDPLHLAGKGRLAETLTVRVGVRGVDGL